MPRKNYTEEQIVYALRQAEGGTKVSDICREMGVSQQAFYSWKKALCGSRTERAARTPAAAAREPKAQVAGGGPDAGQTPPAGGARKKALKPAARRQLVSAVRQGYELSEKRACGLIGITRWINRYQSRGDPQTALRMRIRELAGSRVRYGYRRLTALLRREGWAVNAKRVYRLYRDEGLQVPARKRRKRAAQVRVSLPEAVRPNQRWSMDFVSDRLSGRALVSDFNGD